MSLKFGKLVLVPQNNEQKSQVLIPSGNSFKFGYYMFCDYIHEHPQAKGIHCEINCDAFGRVTILNFSKEHPISLNGRAVRNKRHLLNGNTIEILDKKFQWFYSTKRSKGQEGTDVTPQKKIQIRQMPFSEPSRKKTRGDAIHSFTVQTRKDQQSEESDSEMEKVIKAKDDARKSKRDSFKENISQSLINITAKDCFVAENVVTPSKQKNLSCYRSETVFTSYSPKAPNSRLSRSFSFITPTRGSPKSLYGTPRSVLSEKNDNLSKSFDLIEFSTPYNKLEKRSMHLIDLTSAGKLKTPQRTGSPLLKSALRNSVKSIKRLPLKFTTITEENCNKSVTLKSALKNTSLRNNNKLVASAKKTQLFTDDNNTTLEKTVTISPYIEQITINSTKDSTIDLDQCSSTYMESVIEISEDDSSKNFPNASKLRTPTSAKTISNSVKTPRKITPKIAQQQKSVSKVVDKKITNRTLSRSASLASKVSNSAQKDKITKINTSSLAIRKRSKSVSFEPNNKMPMMSALIRGKQDSNLTTSTPIARQSISFRRNLDNNEGRITPKRHSCFNMSTTTYSTKKGPVLSVKKTQTVIKKTNVTAKNTEDVLNTTFSIETPTSKVDKLPDHSFKVDERPESNKPAKSNFSEKRKTLRMSVTEKTSYASMSKDISHTPKEKSSNVSIQEKVSSESTPLKVSSELGVSKKLFNTPVKAQSSPVVEVKEKSARSIGNAPKSKEDKLTGIKQLLKTPKTPMKDNFEGVRELMSTPKVNKNLNLSGVREMMNSPVVNQNSVLEAVDTSKSCYEGVRESMSTPTCKNDETNIVTKKDGVTSTAEDTLNHSKLVKTPYSSASPNLTGIKELFTTQNILLNESLDGIPEIFKTPSAKMVMMIGTPKSVNVNSNTSSVELQPALFDPRENMDEMEDIFKTPISNLLERTENKLRDCELSAEDSFDRLVGRRSIKYSYTRTPKKSPINYCEGDSDLPKTDIEEWVDSVNKSFEIEDDKNISKMKEVAELARNNETIGVDAERQNKTFSSGLSEALFYSDDESQDFEKSKAESFTVKSRDSKALQTVHCTDLVESEKQEKPITPITHNSGTKSSTKSTPAETNKRSATKQTLQKIDLTPMRMTLRARSNTPVLQSRNSRRINQSLRDVSVDNIEAQTVPITPRKSQRITANQSQKNTPLVLERSNRSKKEEKSVVDRKTTRLSMCSTPKSKIPRISHEFALKSDGFKFESGESKIIEVSQGKDEDLDGVSQDTENNLSASKKILDDKSKSPNIEFSQSDLDTKKVSENIQQDQSLQSIKESATTPIIVTRMVRSTRKTLDSKSLEIQKVFENFEENPELPSERTGKSFCNIKEHETDRRTRRTVGNAPTTAEPLDIQNLKDQLEMERAFENFKDHPEHLGKRGQSISPVIEKKQLRLPRKTLGCDATANEPLDAENLKAQLEMERAFENFEENAEPRSTRSARSISAITEKKSLKLPRKTVGSKPSTDEPLDVDSLKSQLEIEQAFENFQENAEPRSARTAKSISSDPEKKTSRLPRKTLGSKPATDKPLDLENLKDQLEMERAFENFQETPEPRSTRTVRSISPIAEKKSLRLPRKTLGSKPATDDPLDIENLKDQLEMERAFENFQENAEPRSTRTVRSISPIAEKKPLRLPRKTLGSKPATDEPLDIENLKEQLEMERAFENFQENAEPRSTRTVRSISPIAEKKSLRLPRKTLGSKPATDKPLDIENLKDQLEMERAFENFQENAEPRSTRTVRSISPIVEKKSLRLPRKTLGSKPATDEPLDIENLKDQLEMERAFENFQETPERRSTRTAKSISPIAEKKPLRLPRKTLGSKPATDEPLDIENLKDQLEMERAFENFQETPEPRSTRTVRSISPIAEKKSLRLPRKTLGSKPATDEPLDIENLKDQLEMERAFENFQETPEPRSTRTVRSISPIAEKKSLRLPRKTLGSKPATEEPLDIENLKDQLEMERAFENFQETPEPRSTRTVRSISPIAEKKSLRLPRKTLGSKPATEEPLDIENLKDQLEMERAFENFQENAEPRSTRTVRSISPIAEKKSLRLPRKTLGSKPATEEPLDIENLKDQLEMERAFENFQETPEPRSTRTVRSISPIAEKKSVRLPRKTLGSKPATEEPLDIENLKDQLEMERAFENFQETPEPRSTRKVRSISPIVEKKSLRLPRKTLGSKPATDEPLDIENLKDQLEMERAFENFQENAEPRSTRTARSISPITEKKSQRLPRKTLGSKPATDEPLDIENLKDQLEMERAFENFQENAEPRSTRTVRSISPIAEKKPLRLPRKTLGSKPATDEPLDVESLKAQIEMEQAFENFKETPEPRSTKTARSAKSISPIVEEKQKRIARTTIGEPSANRTSYNVQSVEAEFEMRAVFENFQNKHKISNITQVEEVGITDAIGSSAAITEVVKPENLEIDNGTLENIAEDQEIKGDQSNIERVQQVNSDKVEKELNDRVQENPDEIAANASPVVKRRRYVKKAEKVEQATKMERVTRTRRQKQKVDVDIDASAEMTTQARDEEKLQINSDQTEDIEGIESKTEQATKEQSNPADISLPTKSKSERVKRKVTFLNEDKAEPSPNVSKGTRGRRGRKVTVAKETPVDETVSEERPVDENLSNNTADIVSENIEGKRESGETPEIEIIHEKRPTRNLRKGKRIVKSEKLEEELEDERQNRDNETMDSSQSRPNTILSTDIKMKIQEVEEKEAISTSTTTRRRKNIEKSESESENIVEHDSRTTRRNRTKKVLIKESAIVQEESETRDTLEQNSEINEQESGQNQVTSLATHNRVADLATVKQELEEVTEEIESVKEVVEKSQNLRKRRGKTNKNANDEAAEPSESIETDEAKNLSSTKRIKLNTSSKKEDIAEEPKTVEETEDKTSAEVNLKRTRGRRLAETSKHVDTKADQSNNELQLEENGENQITTKESKTRTRLARSRKINKDAEINDGNQISENSDNNQLSSTPNSAPSDENDKNLTIEKQNLSQSVEVENSATKTRRRGRPAKLNTNIEAKDEAQKENRRPTRKRAAVVENVVKPKERIVVKEEQLSESEKIEEAVESNDLHENSPNQNNQKMSESSSKPPAEITTDNDTADELQTSTPIRKSRRNAGKSNKLEFNESKEIKEEAVLPKRTRRRKVELVATENHHHIGNSTNNDESVETMSTTTENGSKMQQNTKKINVSSNESKVDVDLEFKTPIKAAPRAARRLRSNSVTSILTPILADQTNETNPSDSILSNDSTHITSETKITRRGTRRNKKNDETNEEEESGTSLSTTNEEKITVPARRTRRLATLELDDSVKHEEPVPVKGRTRKAQQTKLTNKSVDGDNVSQSEESLPPKKVTKSKKAVEEAESAEPAIPTSKRTLRSRK